MEYGKRIRCAFVASLLLNTAFVAVAGQAAGHNKPLHKRPGASVQPTLMRIADASQWRPAHDGSAHGDPGDGSSGDGADQAGKDQTAADSGDGPSGGHGHIRAIYTRTGHDAQSASAESTGTPKSGREPAPGSPKASAREGHFDHGNRPYEERHTSRVKGAATGGASQNADASSPGKQMRPGARPENRQAPGQMAKGMNGQTQLNSQLMDRQTLSPAGKGIKVVTRPGATGHGGRVTDYGNSVAPKMVKYPEMKADLGTIHMTRPTHGVTGGGSADLRNVSITAHYVVDDPQNVPKTLAPNRTVHMFASHCNGDPGNLAKCLPTGGNTVLGGTTLHGAHNHITGVKYCVPGAGGPGTPGGNMGRMPAGQANANVHMAQARNPGRGGSQGRMQIAAWGGRLAGGGQVISQAYRGGGPTRSEPERGWEAGRLNPLEPLARVTNALHLPVMHADARGLTPGARVPERDRRWVSDPAAHADEAPLGRQTPALPRFRISPRDVGSVSRFGTVAWARPARTRPHKAAPGGDGTGLLGLYYLGNNFQTLVAAHPDRNIDYAWTASPPEPRIPHGAEYSVRWIGKLVPRVSGTYTLMTDSDDGVRLYLDGHLILANWTVHGPAEDTATVHLTAGREYPMKLEYYENGYGYAAMRLYWEGPQTPRQYIPEQCLRYPRLRLDAAQARL